MAPDPMGSDMICNLPGQAVVNLGAQNLEGQTIHVEQSIARSRLLGAGHCMSTEAIHESCCLAHDNVCRNPNPGQAVRLCNAQHATYARKVGICMHVVHTVHQVINITELLRLAASGKSLLIYLYRAVLVKLQSL